jgi:hypothetical protein
MRSKFYTTNKTKILLSAKKFYLENKKVVQDRQRLYNSKNKDSINQRVKLRRQQDPAFKVACSLRNRLNRAIRSDWKSGSAVTDLGCSILTLKNYLESKFLPGMNWANYGKWHIDHVVPLSKFDLTKRKELLQACHYTNLQPLWAIDNIQKGANYAQETSHGE